MVKVKTVHLQYFALFREWAGRAAEARQTRAGTLGELYAELREAYGFPLGPEQVRAAVGEEYRDLEAPVEDGMQVVFLPPVAGG